MNKIIQFCEDITEGSNQHEKFPEFFNNSNKKKICFVTPPLDVNGFYKAILPCYELNKTERFACMLTGIMNLYQNKNHLIYENQDITLTEEIVKLSNYIVMPYTYQDLRPEIEMIRSINPACKVIYSIDHFWDNLPRNHPERLRLQNGAKQEVINNVKSCDIVLVTNKYLGQEAKKINEQVVLMPIYNSLDRWEGVVVNPMEEEPFKVIISATPHNNHDLEHIKPFLLHLNKKYEKKVEITVFGHDGSIINYDAKRKDYVREPSDKSVLKGVRFEYRKPVNVLHYQDQVAKGGYHLAIIPYSKCEFNDKSKNYHEYLEFSYLEIPTMMDKNIIYDDILGDKMAIVCTGFEEWKEAFDKFYKKRDELKQFGNVANDWVNSYLSYNENTIQVFDRIFK